MAYTFDSVTREIVLPCGDTLSMRVALNGDADFDVVIFAIYNKDTGEDIFKKPAAIENGEAVIRLTNTDTRDLPEGKYLWQLRIVSDAEYDESGNVIADEDSDNVVSLFGPENIPVFRLRRDGAYV